MIFFPFIAAKLETALSKDEVLTRLNALIGEETTTDQVDLNGLKRFSYTGQVANDTFALRRKINYNNSFLPQLQGQLIESGNAIRVELNLSLLTYVKRIMVLLMTLPYVVVLLLTWFGANADGFQLELLMPLVMPLVIYGVGTIAFKLESRKAVDDLQQLLNATILS